MRMESLHERYRDVAEPIVLKTEVLRRGLKFSSKALDVVKEMNIVFKGYHLFSYDLDAPVTIRKKIPADFFLRKDNTYIQSRINEKSPFNIDLCQDKFFLYEDDHPLEEIYFAPAPEFYSKSLPDGTPMASIVQPIGDLLFVTVNKFCEMWKDGNQCLFCDFNEQTKIQRKEGEKIVVHKDPSVVAEVLRIAFKETGFRHLFVTGGTLLDSFKGKSEIEYYSEFFEAIQQKLKVLYPTHFQMIARTKEEFRRLKEAGVGFLQPNLEVWDRDLFKTICPGKEKYVGYDNWIQRMIDAVEIFGPGRVVPNFVAGVEMARPFGFKDVSSALRSTLGGFDFLMANGILPRMDMWTIEPNSALGGQEPPPLEFYIELGRGYRELCKKHGFDAPLGRCRGCYRIDTTYDWEYYYP